MAVGNPGWTLSSLEALDELGSIRDDDILRIWLRGSRLGGRTVWYRTLTQVGSNALLREPSRQRLLHLCCCQGLELWTLWITRLFRLLLEHGHVNEELTRFYNL